MRTFDIEDEPVYAGDARLVHHSIERCAGHLGQRRKVGKILFSGWGMGRNGIWMTHVALNFSGFFWGGSRIPGFLARCGGVS